MGELKLHIWRDRKLELHLSRNYVIHISMLLIDIAKLDKIDSSQAAFC